MGGQFAGIQDKLIGQGPRINTTSRDEHVSKVEHYTPSIKKLVWCIYNNLAFQIYAILLAANGRGSASKRTRHMDIRYFFVKNPIVSSKISVVQCPTTT